MNKIKAFLTYKRKLYFLLGTNIFLFGMAFGVEFKIESKASDWITAVSTAVIALFTIILALSWKGEMEFKAKVKLNTAFRNFENSFFIFLRDETKYNECLTDISDVILELKSLAYIAKFDFVPYTKMFHYIFYLLEYDDSRNKLVRNAEGNYLLMSRPTQFEKVMDTLIFKDEDLAVNFSYLNLKEKMKAILD